MFSASPPDKPRQIDHARLAELVIRHNDPNKQQVLSRMVQFMGLSRGDARTVWLMVSSMQAVETRVAVRTHVGLRRTNNEDSVKVTQGGRVVLVADGAGGLPAGEIASRLAVDGVAKILSMFPNGKLESIILTVGETIKKHGDKVPNTKGMCSTLVALRIKMNGDLNIRWVGDSRAYLMRRGILERLTNDRPGFLGNENVGIGTYDGRARKNDLYLLCTDGLTNYAGERRIEQILSIHRTLEARADLLVAEALSGGGSDNVTVALIGVK